eukprot:10799393-Alexandrium_andersonii.AAC.1
MDWPIVHPAGARGRTRAPHVGALRRVLEAIDGVDANAGGHLALRAAGGVLPARRAGGHALRWLRGAP